MVVWCTTFVSIFIAQAYGVQLDLGTQMTMLLVLITSKGIAGVPRASLVVVAATLYVWHSNWRDSMYNWSSLLRYVSKRNQCLGNALATWSDNGRKMKWI
jgi:Na+/H+-dicarboxylate symporter